MMMYEERYAGRNPHYAPFRALRLPDKSREEFLASTDVWFRPVAFANGPEGALYIADLYREIIDFSDGVPESVKRIKDLNRGNDRGRIYRVVPEEFQQPSPPRLGSHSTGELVATLAHPNAWHRESASRLLYETETSVTLRQPFGSENTLLRSNISRIQSLEQSIMPEGLEEGLSVQDMADLLEFVVNAEEEDWGP